MISFKIPPYGNKMELILACTKNVIRIKLMLGRFYGLRAVFDCNPLASSCFLILCRSFKPQNEMPKSFINFSSKWKAAEIPSEKFSHNFLKAFEFCLKNHNKSHVSPHSCTQPLSCFPPRGLPAKLSEYPFLIVCLCASE